MGWDQDNQTPFRACTCQPEARISPERRLQGYVQPLCQSIIPSTPQFHGNQTLGSCATPTHEYREKDANPKCATDRLKRPWLSIPMVRIYDE